VKVTPRDCAPGCLSAHILGLHSRRDHAALTLAVLFFSARFSTECDGCWMLAAPAVDARPHTLPLTMPSSPRCTFAPFAHIASSAVAHCMQHSGPLANIDCPRCRPARCSGSPSPCGKVKDERSRATARLVSRAEHTSLCLCLRLCLLCHSWATLLSVQLHRICPARCHCLHSQVDFHVHFHAVMNSVSSVGRAPPHHLIFLPPNQVLCDDLDVSHAATRSPACPSMLMQSRSTFWPACAREQSTCWLAPKR
jgi:hypothetical protein